MAYTEVVVVWSGANGLPGYSKFRAVTSLSSTQLNAFAANVMAFFSAIKALVPAIVTFTMQPGASVHEDDGTLINEATITSLPAPVVCTGSGAYSAASGILVLWNTGAVNGGKKVRGRTYLVPVSTTVLQADGTIVDAQRTVVQTAANTLVGATPAPAINSRARASNPLATNATVQVVSAVVSDKQVVLRSRRD